MALSSPSFLMDNANGVIPYSAVSFQARNSETSFCHLLQYGAKNHRIRVDISAAVLRWWLFADLCGLRSITAGPNEHKIFPIAQTFNHLLYCIVLYSNCSGYCIYSHTPVILNYLIHSLLVAFIGGCSRATAPRLILNARVTFFKISPIFEHCSHPWTHFHKHAEVIGEFLQQGFPLSQEIRWQHDGETT